jgi:hypothetical protein
MLRDLIINLFLWAILYFKDANFINEFLNYNRNKYLWTEINYLDPVILRSYRNNFDSLLNELVINTTIIYNANIQAPVNNQPAIDVKGGGHMEVYKFDFLK